MTQSNGEHSDTKRLIPRGQRSFHVVTSFNEAGYEQYGHNFIKSFNEYWPDNVCLHIFWESEYSYAGLLPGRKMFQVYDLLTDIALHEFDKTYGWVDSKNYRFKASKFARKVFALTSPHLPTEGTRIWLDADTITTNLVTAEWLNNVCQGDISYLGRKDWNHSECGFVSYNLNRFPVCSFLNDFIEIYTSGEIWDHEEWHDSYLFDRVLERHPNLLLNNLSDGIPGLNVWEHTVLAEKMTHLKGNLKNAL